MSSFNANKLVLDSMVTPIVFKVTRKAFTQQSTLFTHNFQTFSLENRNFKHLISMTTQYVHIVRKEPCQENSNSSQLPTERNLVSC